MPFTIQFSCISNTRAAEPDFGQPTVRELRIPLQTGGSTGVFLDHSGDDLTSVHLRNLCLADKLLWIPSVKPLFQTTLKWSLTKDFHSVATSYGPEFQPLKNLNTKKPRESKYCRTQVQYDHVCYCSTTVTTAQPFSRGQNYHLSQPTNIAGERHCSCTLLRVAFLRVLPVTSCLG